MSTDLSVFSVQSEAAAGRPPDAAEHAHPALRSARLRAQADGLSYAGAIDPQAAHELFESGAAMLVDVRTAEELKFVGAVPGAVHVAWQTGPAMVKNPRFLKELAAKAGPETVVLFICRSGKRSADAAAAAARAGYAHAYNVLEGFEGGPDVGPGWRSRGLPAIQP